MDTDSLDAKKLRQENEKLKKTLKELTVEKNLMQHQMLRAFNKLLNTKKRRIKQLERKLKDKKGDEEDQEEDDVHCDTCRCNRKGDRKKSKLEVANATGHKESDDSDSDTTMDPGSDYGSETELDEEPASRSSNYEPMKEPEPSASPTDHVEKSSLEKAGEMANQSENGMSPSLITGGSIQDPGPSSEIGKDSSQSDYDMDALVDEICK